MSIIEQYNNLIKTTVFNLLKLKESANYSSFLSILDELEMDPNV